MLHSRRILSHICLVVVVGVVALAGVILSPRPRTARRSEIDIGLRAWTYFFEGGLTP